MNRRPVGFIARAFQWRVRIGRTRALGPLVPIVELVLVAIAFQLLGALWLKRSFTPAAMGIFLGFFAVGHALTGSYLPTRKLETSLVRALLGTLLAIVGYGLVRKYLHGVVSPLTFGETLLALLPLQGALRYFSAQDQPDVGIHPFSRAVADGLGRAFRWPGRAEADGTWAFTLLLADGLLGASVARLIGGFWLERSFAAGELRHIGLIVAASHALVLTYAHRLPRRPWFLAGKIVAGNALAWVLLTHGEAELPHPAPFAAILLPFALLQAAFHCWHRRRSERHGGVGVLDPLYAAILATAVLALHWPLLTTGSIGAGDSYWYNIMTADFVSQWRAGIFPVFAGQTEFAFNGALAPLRFAPGVQHLAGLVDLLTAHSLPFTGILNLTLLGSFLGGAFMGYLCLRAVTPRTPLLALLLALLYGSCPGILALAYTGDLFMSVTAVIFVPLAFYGCWRTLAAGDLRGVLLMVFGLAALWYCHPPIALWCSFVAAGTQLIRLFREARRREVYGHWLAGLAAFAVLACCCFVSVGTAAAPPHPVDPAAIVGYLQSAFPGSLKPVSATADALGDYQLGWSLWGALLVSFLALPFLRGRRSPALALVAGAVGVLLFVIPIPWLMAKLWATVPRAVCDITFLWAMQRLYVVLAGLAAFAAAAAVGPLVAGRRGWLLVAALLLVVGVCWSFREAGKFQRHVVVSTPEQARRMLLPQNRILTRYAFGSFKEAPSYFSHGFIDPLVTSRLLDASGAELFSAMPALERGLAASAPVAEGELRAHRLGATEPHLGIEPALHLEPHRRYLLQFAFAHPEFEGALRLVGSRMSRAYWLPDSAYGTTFATPSRAFGARPDLSHGLTLWTDGDEAEEVSLSFFFTGDGPATEVTSFGKYQLREFDPAGLPIQIQRWAPYRAVVDTAVPAVLETPRQFVAGYQARVNGRTVPVGRSRDALVSVPVPAGKSTVEVTYRGPFILRCAYFLSAAGALVLLGWFWVSYTQPVPEPGIRS